MMHEMKLQPEPFEKIKDGSKTIEIRLNDEKRRLIREGDGICFSRLDDATQKVHVHVVSLDAYPSFEKLFAAYPPEHYGATKQSDWSFMYTYYAPEDEKKYGVLAIGIKLSSDAVM